MRLIPPCPAFPGLILLLLFCAPTRAQNLELSSAQRQWVAAHKEIRVAPDADFAPIDSIANDGRERGLTADYLKLIGTRTGLSFRVVREHSRADALQALREHRVDLLPSAFVNTQQQNHAIYSAPYLRLSGAIYVRNDEPGFTQIGQLDGHKVAVITGWAWPDVLQTKGSTAKVQGFDTPADALTGLRDKSVDAYIGDPFTTAQAIDTLKFNRDITLSGQLGVETPLAMAVRSDWPQLRDVLDVALKSVSVEEEKTLRERWLKNAAATSGDASATAPAFPPSQADAIDAALRSQSLAREPSDVRKQVEDLLHQAQDDEARASQLAEQWQSLNQTASEADASAQKLVDTLALDDTAALLAWRAALPERATVEQLESLLTRERDAQTAARAAVTALQTELDRQTQRPAQIRDELVAGLAMLEKNRITPAVSGSALGQARLLRAQAATRLATIQIALLNLENRSYEPRMRLLAAQLRDRQRTASELDQHVAALENLVLDRTGAVAANLQDSVQRQRDQIDPRLRLLTDAANTNVALAGKVVESVKGLEQLRVQKQAWDGALRDTEQSLKNTEERIQIGGVSEAVGLILLAEKSRLKPVPVLKRSLARVQTDLAQTRMSLIDLREQQADLDDLGAAVTRALSRLPDVPAERLNELRTGMYRLLNTRATILPQLLVQQTRLANAERDSEQGLRNLVATTEKLGGILDARLLWTPSHEPVDRDWPGQLGLGVQLFFTPLRWLRVARNAGLAIVESPLTSLAAVLGLAALYLLRRRALIRLEQITSPMRRIRTDRYRLTGEALWWTVLEASPLPALLWVLGNLCRMPPSTSGGFTEAVGYALSSVAWTAFALAFLRELTVEKGLAQYHFRWPRPRREALHDAVPWLALTVLPTQFFLSVMQLRGDNDSTSSVGRFLLTLSVAGFGVLLWQLFAPGRVWTTRNALLHEPLRLRQTTRIALCTSCFLLAALVLRGYFVTAFALSGRVLSSLVVVLAIATVHGLAVRWLVLGERRLALKRMEQKQESEGEQRERSEGEKLPEPEPEQITIASVSTQTRRLLRALTVVALVAALLLIWSEVMPAIAFLKDIPVWKAQHLSLLDLLEALIVLTLTWVATRNMPGLIEIGVLRRFNMDAPTRYAITSVTRYVIVFTGTILGLSMLGLHWSNLQWLAAGFSVGLGFGMQEIFANFISGLMVLFERPFRVGDVITIGTVEGTVTRIRTRATTIVDWDNKEVMVPNKSFITDRLVNWTLSDSITRVVIKIGVAYRNDPAQAQKLLLDVARAHAQVLADPEPTCWMMGFGDSTQDFELRVYVAEIGQRNLVRTELQMRIAEVFRNNDIELAFPQLDVRLLQPDAPSAAAIKDSKRS